jgi:hypothetical protein
MHQCITLSKLAKISSTLKECGKDIIRVLSDVENQSISEMKQAECEPAVIVSGLAIQDVLVILPCEEYFVRLCESGLPCPRILFSNPRTPLQDRNFVAHIRIPDINETDEGIADGETRSDLMAVAERVEDWHTEQEDTKFLVLWRVCENV